MTATAHEQALAAIELDTWGYGVVDMQDGFAYVSFPCGTVKYYDWTMGELITDTWQA